MSNNGSIYGSRGGGKSGSGKEAVLVTGRPNHEFNYSIFEHTLSYRGIAESRNRWILSPNEHYDQ